ncbi:MAG: hypothetical protein AAF492_18725, partial [Verrucomicrobiota bacterium]
MTQQPIDESDLFLDAIYIKWAVERVAWLVDACGGDEPLLKRVRALVAHHTANDPHLDRLPSFSLP